MKSEIGSKEVSYLGFCLTKARILPGNCQPESHQRLAAAIHCPRSSPMFGCMQLFPHTHPELCPDHISLECHHKEGEYWKGGPLLAGATQLFML